MSSFTFHMRIKATAAHVQILEGCNIDIYPASAFWYAHSRKRNP